MPTLIPRDKIQDFIGFESEPTSWLHIDQHRIDAFAECTLDRQFIHVDPEAAKLTPFGGTIAHGFLTLEPDVEVMYKVTNYYNADADGGIRFDDPALGIDWGLDGAEPVLSGKDRELPLLADAPEHFRFG